MSLMQVQSFVAGDWVTPQDSLAPLHNAFTGEVIGHAGTGAPDVMAMYTMRWQMADRRCAR